MRIGERAQFGEGDGLIGARRRDRVDADREVEDAGALGLRRRKRDAGREDAAGRLEGGGKLRLECRLAPAVREREGVRLPPSGIGRCS
jgi:hypothetical protein